MARRGTRSTSTTDTENTTPEESTVAETATESTEATEPTTDASTEAAAPAADENPVDLANFKSAIESALADADDTTGDLPEAALAEVTKAYRELDGLKAKNAAKAYVNDQMKDAMNASNLAQARSYLQISDKGLVAAAGGSATKAPADPTENFVQRVATLTLAYQLATTSVPEGVADGWQDKATELTSSSFDSAKALLDWNAADPETRGEEPEASAVVRNAVKLSAGKAAKAGVSRGGGTFTGERRDVGVHILNAFEDVDEGVFLTIAEIVNKRSDEYGDAKPSPGAVSARLFPTGSRESSMIAKGIQPDTRDGKKGAIKVAVSE